MCGIHRFRSGGQGDPAFRYRTQWDRRPDVEGIREEITHRHTGYLCGTAPGDIRNAIQTVMGDAHLRRTMAANARQFVVENYSVERVLELELNMLQSVVGQR